ncbi:MAG: hypothetical protein M1168_03875 [Candidatus Marsarchaeota archaeon]|nr:hypothetical protein [Candidatus Marsarchaeota archaeon]MCL5095087.1 hypothetical protein [Candidatus Marsarchaeota archaeon]
MNKSNLDAIIKHASSNFEIEDMLSKLKEINTKTKFIQLFDTNSVINKEHLLCSYLNALTSFKEKQNSSKILSIEMLLFAAMTRQINLAISLAGIKNKSDFIVFSNDAKKYNIFKKYLNKETDFNPSLLHMENSAKRYKIILKNSKKLIKKEIQNLININMFQKIAVSKIKDA